MTLSSPCPCGANLSYEECCAPYHEGSVKALTAEILMRSRYSAFALHKFDYIVTTQKLAEQPNPTADEIAKSGNGTQWSKLEIWETQDGNAPDQHGMVSFTAHFQDGHQAGQLSERSWFEKIDGDWTYVSGEHTVQHAQKAKVGRNDPCFCGSGKKSKKCCG